MDYSRILPDYPRTQHLPYKANAKRDDLIVQEKDADIIFQSENTYVEEKIDGASVGITVIDGNPVVRNRNHILHKGFQARTPAKMQFSSIWNWYYENRDKFHILHKMMPNVTLYGEWMYAVHGIHYDQLPDLFIPYDLWDCDNLKFIDTIKTRTCLIESGFATVPLLHCGPVKSWEQLESFTQEQTPFATDIKREGIYLKVTDGKWITHRFKMIRTGFLQGEHWSKTSIQRNKVT